MTPVNERTHKEIVTRQRNGARRICTHPLRTLRRQKAASRAARRALLSCEEQLEVLLHSRPGASTKERARLNEQIVQVLVRS